MPDTMQSFVISLMEAWNSHDLDLIASFYAPDYEGSDVSQAKPHHGPDGIRAMFERIQRALPDVEFILEQTVIQEDTVVLVWTSRGTHQGYMMNIPPTGRTVEARGTSVLTLCGDKVGKALYIWDVAAILRGIGLLPEL